MLYWIFYHLIFPELVQRILSAFIPGARCVLILGSHAPISADASPQHTSVSTSPRLGLFCTECIVFNAEITSFEKFDNEGIELHLTATNIFKHVTTERCPRFMDLPLEVRIMILGELLDEPGHVISSKFGDGIL